MLDGVCQNILHSLRRELFKNARNRRFSSKAVIAVILADRPLNGVSASNKKTITGDKKEYTAYVWNGTAWEAMDGNYSADNVFMSENMIITEKFGKYDIPPTGSRELECAGMTVKAFINDAFA